MLLIVWFTRFIICLHLCEAHDIWITTATRPSVIVLSWIGDVQTGLKRNKTVFLPWVPFLFPAPASNGCQGKDHCSGNKTECECTNLFAYKCSQRWGSDDDWGQCVWLNVALSFWRSFPSSKVDLKQIQICRRAFHLLCNILFSTIANFITLLTAQDSGN